MNSPGVRRPASWAWLAFATSAAAIVCGCTSWQTEARSERDFLRDFAAQSPKSSSHAALNSSPGWPNLLGPNGHSVSRETGLASVWTLASPAVAWQREIGTGYSSPVVNDEGLLLLHRVRDHERLECLNPETGTEKWVSEYPTRYKCEYRYSSGPYSTPVIAGQLAFAQSAEGVLRCLDMTTGDLLWKRELSREYAVPQADWGVGHSPCVAGDRIFINLGGTPDAGVIALDRDSGKTLWTSTDYHSSYATPVFAQIHGLEHLFVFNYEGCVSLNPADGKERWFLKFGTGSRTGSANAVSPLVCDDLLLLTAGPGPGSLCLRVLADGGYEQVWRDRRSLDSQFNNQICLAGHVYGFTSKWQGEASLVCLELGTGKVRWKHNSELGRGSGLAADGRLILLGETGLLGIIDANPERLQVRKLFNEPLLSAPCYSMPALHRGLLYLRNERQLLCVSMRPGA